MTEDDTFNRLRRASHKEACEVVYRLIRILPNNIQYKDWMDDPVFIKEFTRATGWTRKDWFDSICILADND